MNSVMVDITCCLTAPWVTIKSVSMNAHVPSLLFAGPGASMYTYGAMPFGPVNGLEIFISMMFDINTEWQDLAVKNSATINEDTNSKLIVDDVFSHAINEDSAFKYIESQFIIAGILRLSFSLPKCRFFVERLDFVGTDIRIMYNIPSKSKFELLKTWPKAVDVRAGASFVAFGMWHSKWIPYFEVKVQPLRTITNTNKWDTKITPELWTKEAEASWKFVIEVIISDPYLARYDHRKRTYIQPGFCQIGMAFVAMQPVRDEASMATMLSEMKGGTCEFLKDPPKDNPTQIMLRLKTVTFGSQKFKGYERKLHSYLGEGFAGDWGLGKCSHYLWGMQNTWITDQFVLTFLLNYDGSNGPFCRLQIRIMMMHVDIVHRNARHVAGADYGSREGGDLWFDPLISEHNAFPATLRKNNAAPMGPMLPQNMPGYRASRKYKSDITPIDISTHSLFIFSPKGQPSHSYLSIYPSVFGLHTKSPKEHALPTWRASNSDLSEAEYKCVRIPWMTYGMSCGHFLSTIKTEGFLYDVILAADPDTRGRDMLRQYSDFPRIVDGLDEFLKCAKSSVKFSIKG